MGVDFLNPESGLSSLFRWAVPKLCKEYDILLSCFDTRGNIRAELHVIGDTKRSYESSKDPAEALARAILKVIALSSQVKEQ